MDKLPPELVSSPRPLVFITGEVETLPNIHRDLIAQLYLHAKHDPKHEVHMRYESISADYPFKEKSPAKDHPSPEGILKSDWMHKHCSLLPSLIILTASFGTDWPAGEWIRRETTIIERITQLKHFMQQRDVKVILILLKLGHQTIDKDVIDERLNAIKRHCQLESKSFVILSAKDLVAGLKDSLKRLTKTVRDFSAGYYVSQGKRLRGMERLIRPSDYTLITRMNFKVAFFYEFQLQVTRALRNYKQCYASLTDLHKLSLTKPEKISQIKAVAEIVNFKLCNIQLKSGAVKEASQQFRQHMTTFSSSKTHFEWLDHTWAANQFLIYVSLLTHYSINTNHTDADRSYYYHRAALCTQKRFDSFQERDRSNCSQELEDLHKKYANITMTEPKFFGSAPQYVNDSNTKSSSKLTASSEVVPAAPSSTDLWSISQYSQLLLEEKVNHVDEILALLQKSLKNINPLHKRRKSHIRVLIAKQLMSIGDYDMASAHLSSLIDFLYREQWSFCAIPVLRKKMLCAIYLGRPREYIPAALKLYKIAVLDDFFDVEDRMELHRDFMSIIQNTEKPTVAFLENIRDQQESTSSLQITGGTRYINLPLRPEYGAAAMHSHPPEYFLPDSYVVELGDVSNGLFRIAISYDQKSIEVGHHVKTHIAVTSLFQDVIRFTEMSAFFTDDVIIQKFIHRASNSKTETEEENIMLSLETDTDIDMTAADSTANITYASLEFHPHVKKTFSFDMFISENSLYKNETNHICLERLLFTMAVPLPTQTSGEAILTLEEERGHAEEGVEERNEEDLLVMMDSLQIEEALQKELHQDSMDAAVTLLHAENNNDIPDNSSALSPQGTVTLQLDETVITTDDVNIGIDMQEESLDIPGEEPFLSQDMDDEERDNDDNEEHYKQELEGSEEDEEKEEEGEDMDTRHESDDEDIDQTTPDIDDDLTPASSPSKPGIHSKESTSSCDERPDTPPADLLQTLDNPDNIVSNTKEQEEQEEDDEIYDDEDVDPHRMSTSRLGMMVPDLNKLDPVMPVVVDKEMQKNRSRSSSLTPSYVAELLSSNPGAAGAGGGVVQTSQPLFSESEFHTRLKSATVLTDSSPSDSHHPRTQSLPQKLQLQSTRNQQTNEIMRQRGYREILFNASALSKTFREARSSNFGTPARAKEIADFLDVQNAPRLLSVTPPISYVHLLSPAPLKKDDPICILQGTIQRVNFVFSSGDHPMLGGKIFFKSDYHQLRNGNGSQSHDDSHFFWYPSVATLPSSLSCGVNGLEAQSSLDMIHFHPFTNNTEDNQPVYPVSLPDQDMNSIFVCPVFVKSDVQGEINLTLKIEYIPSIFLKNSISKEFHMKIRVLKPFGMNFNITSLSDPHCGSEKKQGTSNVLRGDLINMAASLDCVNSLEFDVEVLVMTVMTRNATVSSDPHTGESIEMPVFKLTSNNAILDNTTKEVKSESVCDLLTCGVAHLPVTSKQSDKDQDKDKDIQSLNKVVKSYITDRPGEKQTVILQKGEAYVGSADLLCLPLQSVESNLGVKYRTMFSEMNSSISASMGDIIVNWRINDPYFFRAVDLTPFQPSVKDTDQCVSDSSGGDQVAATVENDMSWLLPLSENYPSSLLSETTPTSAAAITDEVSPLNTLITHTRVCNMLFSVPKVQIIDAPFAVTIDTPAVVNFGEPFTINLHIFNKLQSLERIVMVAELTSEFLMTGGSYQVLEIAPQSSLAINLTFVPLIAGQVPLPHVCLTCERTKSTVLEFGTYAIPRHVFVKPVSVSM